MRELLQQLFQIPHVVRIGITLEKLEEAVQRGGRPGHLLWGFWTSPKLFQVYLQWARHPQMTAENLLTLLDATNELQCGREAFQILQVFGLERGLDLEDLAQIWQGFGGPDWLAWLKQPHLLKPVFLERFLRKRESQIAADLEVRERRLHSLQLLQCLAPPYARCLDGLWSAALGTTRAEREAAQLVLDQHPSTPERLCQSLLSSQSEVRLQAVLWVVRRKQVEALPDLQKLLAKERVESIRQALLAALKSLGAPLEAYLDRDQLAREAQKVVDKSSLDLSAWARPPLVWKSDGKPVDGVLVKAWLILALKGKSPEPSAFLQEVLSHVEGARAWGEQLLACWIERDTIPQYTAEEIESRVPALAKSLAQAYQNLGTPRGEASVISEARQNLQNCILGSAIADKGILSLTGACGGVHQVEMARAYILRWYGMRAAQCKALVAMLGHLPEPEAVEFLLSLARRFRTKGIQEEAQQRLQQRAQRLGWSVEELADLSLPSGGLDLGSGLELDLGARQVRAQLLSSGKWHWQDQQGKPLKGFPAQTQQDEEALYRDAQKNWKVAQKTARETLEGLRHRLYEAFCCGRRWRLERLRSSLFEHPIARLVCQSLVWLSPSGSFRLDEEGQLLDSQHGVVTHPGELEVWLAHPLDLDGQQLAAWSGHLADYQLISPFPQLSRPAVAKPATPDVERFQGYLINSFDLRNQAQKLGYTRGSAEDGGVFYEYRKSLASSGWQVVLTTTGSELPQKQHTMALESLRFERHSEPVAWEDLPEPLYSEAVADVQQMLAKSSGYREDYLGLVSLG